MSTEQLVAFLGVPAATVRGWRLASKGPRFHRLGKHVRYTLADVAEWIEAQP